MWLHRKLVLGNAAGAGWKSVLKLVSAGRGGVVSLEVVQSVGHHVVCVLGAFGWLVLLLIQTFGHALAGLEDDLGDRNANERYGYEDDLIEDDFIDDADGGASGRYDTGSAKSRGFYTTNAAHCRHSGLQCCLPGLQQVGRCQHNCWQAVGQLSRWHG